MTSEIERNAEEDAWWGVVTSNWDTLLQLIETYHPASVRPMPRKFMPITAPYAEGACQLARDEIRKEHEDKQTMFPVELAIVARAECNTADLYNLLNSTWFGVPESTSCWGIPGFSTLVNLLDDGCPGEYDFDNEEE